MFVKSYFLLKRPPNPRIMEGRSGAFPSNFLAVDICIFLIYTLFPGYLVYMYGTYK